MEVAISQQETSNHIGASASKPQEVKTSFSLSSPTSSLSNGKCNDNLPETDFQSENHSNNAASSKKKSLKVSFKEGPDLIQGYMKPHDPWENVSHWTSEDLVNSYKTACVRLGVKPLSNVILQLKVFSHIKERFEIFNLKGERLDLKQCECLEEVFRRVQFRTVNLEATHLDDETAVVLFDMIEHYSSACRVDISFNRNIGIRGWQACARAIKATPCLKHLDARNCDLNERFIPVIGRSLRMGCHLTVLHIENSSLAGRSLMILVAALKANEVLKDLFLGDNRLMPSDAVHLGMLLNCNHTLNLLDLRNNPIQDTGLGYICDGLQKQPPFTGLQTLVFWNCQISVQGMNILAPLLIMTKNLQTLNIAHNNLHNDGIFRLKEALLVNRSLCRLGLQGCKLSCEGAIALAEVIADNCLLLRIDLRDNYIRTAGMMALSLAMRVNNSVTKLDLDKDVKKDPAVKDFVEQQKRLLNDISNYLMRNQNATTKKCETGLHLELQASMTLSRDTSSLRPEHDPGSIARPQLLDSPGAQSALEDTQSVSVDGIVPVVPLIPNNLPLTGENNLTCGDFLLSPQYTVTPDLQGLLPAGDIGFSSPFSNAIGLSSGSCISSDSYNEDVDIAANIPGMSSSLIEASPISASLNSRDSEMNYVDREVQGTMDILLNRVISSCHDDNDIKVRSFGTNKRISNNGHMCSSSSSNSDLYPDITDHASEISSLHNGHVQDKVHFTNVRPTNTTVYSSDLHSSKDVSDLNMLLNGLNPELITGLTLTAMHDEYSTEECSVGNDDAKSDEFVRELDDILTDIRHQMSSHINDMSEKRTSGSTSQDVTFREDQ